ncbi:MAG: thioredoxin family protein [Anaerolineae bacterium]|nr:thioredoxin family protein [Anaerolineae bacterium]
MTLDIKVLGSGCANCARLEKHVKAAVEQLGVEATITKTGDLNEYAKYNLLATPGLVVNEKLVVAGRVPAVSQIVTLLANALAAG